MTWEQILLFARSLENDAFHDNVSPAQGARLVRLLLEFDRNVVSGNVRTRRRPQLPELEPEPGLVHPAHGHGSPGVGEAQPQPATVFESDWQQAYWAAPLGPPTYKQKGVNGPHCMTAPVVSVR